MKIKIKTILEQHNIKLNNGDSIAITNKSEKNPVMLISLNQLGDLDIIMNPEKFKLKSSFCDIYCRQARKNREISRNSHLATCPLNKKGINYYENA